MVKNCAFVFLKPAAVTDKAKEFVTEFFKGKNIEVTKEGSIDAEEIDKKQLVDNHYYAIASKATILTPDKLNIPKEKFKAQFDVDWDETMKTGKIVNAKDACEKLSMDADQLDAAWAKAKKAKDLIKFGGGFYCGKIQDYYVFNGFFMTMRSTYVKPGASIYYYVVEWDSTAYAWEDFRGKVLGPTDPEDAPKDSLRGAFLEKYKSLGLSEKPNVGENCVHASASPFEAMAERINWLGYRAERDPFGKQLLKAGVTRKLIKDWSKDPQVTYGPIAITKSLFDSVEDTNSDYCLALCQMIAGSSLVDKKKEDHLASLENEVSTLQKELDQYRTMEKSILVIQQFMAKGGKKGDSGGKSSSKGEGKGSSGKGEGKGSSGGKGKGKGKAVEEEPKKRKRNKRGGGNKSN